MYALSEQSTQQVGDPINMFKELGLPKYFNSLYPLQLPFAFNASDAATLTPSSSFGTAATSSSLTVRKTIQVHFRRRLKVSMRKQQVHLAVHRKTSM